MSENNKSNKKNVSVLRKSVQIVVIMLICGIAGYGCGRLAVIFEDKGIIESLADVLKTAAIYSMPIIYPAVIIALLVISSCRYFKAKHMFKTLSEDDEDKMLEIEHSLNLPSMLLSFCLILSLTLFAVFVETIELSKFSDSVKGTIILAASAFFIMSYIVLFVIMRQCVELVKKINPEKRGDLLDLNFHKKWEESSDEAQKLIMYKAGFKAYKVTNYVMMGVYLICLIAQFAFHAGVMPTIAVSIIWLIMTVVFCTESARLER